VIVLELALEPTPERMSARPAHRARLLRLASEGSLHGAGPWADDSGALLIFTADREQVDRIIATDPYYSVPGVRILSIRPWTPIDLAGSPVVPPSLSS
jgi:hypothetical protein